MIKGLFDSCSPRLDKHVEHLYSLVKKRYKYWSRYISIYLTSFHYLIYITFDYA
ncbi:hypothetical protein LKE01_23060 [Lentilactobacillus kefiri]|uniref:Uncharacterized protein n=1 Tax=Lentilactobacillus kefiri TaxID=33962 RepID=A0A511DXB4_LENKE|nr:hypothetical protein LKE01_23060 [Lentilactobacillus kefiri]